MATSSWRMDDLQEYGLAQDLESTNISSSFGDVNPEREAYNMTEVLSNLLSPSSADAPIPFPYHNLDVERFCIFLKVPTAYGVKSGQETLTYLNRGQHYAFEVSCNKSGQEDGEVLFKSVMSLSFKELRLRNCEQGQFETWSSEHPLERMLEVDKVGCGGVRGIQNEDSINSISFVWSADQSATVAFRINCLSTEFAARKHGGEKGVPLQLVLDTYSLIGGVTMDTHIHRAACCVKVFKDKGADRKQKQDLQKMEKLSPTEMASFQTSQPVTYFSELVLPSSSTPLSSPSIESKPSESSPYSRTPPSSAMAAVQQITNQIADISVTSSVQQLRDWLVENRFTAHLSLFANYCGVDLLRLSRKDLVELCGPADGIRLYNALRSRTVRTVYVCIEPEKVYHALYLEQLTVCELRDKVALKLNLPASSVTFLVRLTASGVPVVVDDLLVQNMQEEEAFALQPVKYEDGHYQVFLKDQPRRVQSTSSLEAVAQT